MSVRSGGRPANRLLRLEALRGFAALYVVVHHTTPDQILVAGHDIGDLFRFGQEAVILFFLLSGFVIHYSFQRGSDKSFGQYFWKRALRIYVPLLVALPASYLFAAWAAQRWIDPDPITLMGNLAMLQDWAWAKPNVVVDFYMENGPLWSLSYEWWFYMLYWPVWRLSLQIEPRWRDATVLGVAVLASMSYVLWPLFGTRIIMYFGIWWCGVMLADAYRAGTLRRWQTHLPMLFAMSLITGVLAIGVWLDHQRDVELLFGRHPVIELRHFAFAVVSLASAWAWHRLRWRYFDTIFGPFLILAPISYALYIMHWFLFAKAEYLAFLDNPILEFTGYAVVLLTVCYLVELKLYPAVRRRFMPASKRLVPAVSGNT